MAKTVESFAEVAAAIFKTKVIAAKEELNYLSHKPLGYFMSQGAEELLHRIMLNKLAYAQTMEGRNYKDYYPADDLKRLANSINLDPDFQPEVAKPLNAIINQSIETALVALGQAVAESVKRSGIEQPAETTAVEKYVKPRSLYTELAGEHYL